MTEATSFIERLSALAKRIPREVFHKAGDLDCVALRHRPRRHRHLCGRGPAQPGHDAVRDARQKQQGVGRLHCGTLAQFRSPSRPASNITKAVALAFEGVLIREFRPQFNMRPEALQGLK